MDLVRWRTTWSSAGVQRTTSAARVNAVLKATTGRRKVHTSALVCHASVTTALTRATLSPEHALSVSLPSSLLVIAASLIHCPDNVTVVDKVLVKKNSAELIFIEII